MSNSILDNDEPQFGLAEAARRYGKHPASFTRWIVRGCTAADGSRIQLDGVRLGYKWQTSEAALKRFFARLSTVGAAAREHVVPPKDRAKQIAAACREMELAGA